MVKKIIISYFNSIAAILQENRIQEIIIINDNYQVNDIYIGIVQKIFSSINAAFIKLGKHGKSGFIHINDVKPLKRSYKFSHITDILSVNQLILVQVVKEPTFNKGPRLTANLNLHGRYIVLMPFCDIIVVSRKIYDKNERIHLYSLAVLIKPELMGLLIKASSQGVSETVLLRDLDLLLRQWSFIQKLVFTTTRPCLVYKDEDIVKKIVRDFYDQTISKIIVDSKDGLKLIYYYLKKWSCISPLTSTKLQLYSKQDNILNKFYIKQTIKAVLRPRVKLLHGGYIIIENYEALTIIDVNSGSFNKPESSRETTLRINLYAAMEIAYQLRIRNINGVIVIDFIDMYFQRDQLKLLEHFSNVLNLDDAKPQVVQLSQLGLLELTRRRKGQSLQEIFTKPELIPLQLKYSNFYFPSRLYFKLFSGMSQNSFSSRFLVHRNIRSLFFSKSFYNTRVLVTKSWIFNEFLYRRYFTFIDYDYLVYLFNPKANYIVPLVFYYSLIKCKQLFHHSFYFN
uniref:Ribonuclease E n=1 Tax=Laurenciella marilzae TaxID=1413812 RepID=A0A1Z1M1R0_9FLOR|nr:ribonuclease E [Laurenciella marilzae]ARW59714.1 ribonuclease E [Laurenciella marilzae]